MIKGTFQVAVKAAPTRDAFLKKLADTGVFRVRALRERFRRNRGHFDGRDLQGAMIRPHRHGGAAEQAARF